MLSADKNLLKGVFNGPGATGLRAWMRSVEMQVEEGNGQDTNGELSGQTCMETRESTEKEADHSTPLRWGEIQREAIGRWGVIPSRPARRKHQTIY